jgi:hypothetical protein
MIKRFFVGFAMVIGVAVLGVIAIGSFFVLIDIGTRIGGSLGGDGLKLGFGLAGGVLWFAIFAGILRASLPEEDNV